MYISLGPACSVSYHIRKRQQGPTQFFDWLISSEKSILQVLSNQYLSFKPEFEEFNDATQCYRTKLLPLDKCISIHDVHNRNDVQSELIEKYTRRRLRLLNTIKSQDSIIFIRNAKVSVMFPTLLEQCIKQINPKLKYILVSLTLEGPLKIQERNILYVNKSLLKIDKQTHEECWTEYYIDWDEIFKIVNYQILIL